MRKRQLSKMFGLWTATSAMMFDSAQVIAQRTQRMMKPSYSKADQREFAKMVREKGEAAQQSVWAVSRALVGVGFNPLRMPDVASAALKPIARRARANAKRLGKIKL